MTVTPDERSIEATTPAKAPSLVAPNSVIAVRYNPEIFRYSQYNPVNTPVLNGSNGWTHLWQSKKHLVNTLKDCGMLEHQLFLVHKVLTEGELAGIGLGLGLLESPIEDKRAMKNTASNIGELLQCNEVFGSPTNDAIAFQKTAFLLIAPTAPNEDAPY